jgi:hypothetical protein
MKTLAVKIFSVRPSSMPEERTMSVFTRMNSALRNRQNVRTLVDMTQIRQWYMYESSVSNCQVSRQLSTHKGVRTNIGSAQLSISTISMHDCSGPK